MLLSYLSPEERKAYKQGDWIQYSKNPYGDQEGLKKRYEKEQKDGTYYQSVLKVFCKYCGDPFYTDNRNRKYCSGRCVNDAYMARRKARKEAEREKVCPVCGKPFIGKTKATVYCSAACKQKQYRQNKEALPKSVSANLPKQKTVTIKELRKPVELKSAEQKTVTVYERELKAKYGQGTKVFKVNPKSVTVQEPKIITVEAESVPAEVKTFTIKIT